MDAANGTANNGGQKLEEDVPDAIAVLARPIDSGLDEMALRWGTLTQEQRGSTMRRLADVAPGVLRLLCPDWRRFG